MNIFEMVGAICLIVLCLLIIVIIVLQEGSKRNMGVISGGSSDSFYGKNSTRTREATLKRVTKVLAVSFFILTLAMNILNFIIV